MRSFQTLKKELQEINRDISAFLSSARKMPGTPEQSFRDWEGICAAIDSQMAEEVVKVAVVGPIKSGKSTFVNSLFKADYLKRGAGVVTSIVTRIRSGDDLKAHLYFKSWDEVNMDIMKALTLFPSQDRVFKEADFDLRTKRDREALYGALKNLNSSLLFSDGSRNPNSMLLESYLKGYDAVKNTITSSNRIKTYENELLEEQKSFAGSDSLSVYLKDILLEISGGNIDNDIEFADCQGSDSPNPLHLAMIQNYLLQAHLLIYLISSRTGVRRADIRFLSMIKQMGILDNMMFIINCDFSEHETLGELRTLIEKTIDEISIIKSEPEVYAISSLYNLFKATREGMSHKDKMRFSQWSSDAPFVAFSEQETVRFDSDFNGKLGKERYALLLRNNIERLGVVSAAVSNWSRVNQSVLKKDAQGVDALMSKIQYHQQQMTQLEMLIKNTLEGASQKLKGELKRAVDSFFDVRKETVLQDVLAFIGSYQLSFNTYEADLSTARFSDMLYLVFQEFKTAIDTFLSETITPRIVQFIREQGDHIEKSLMSVSDPYASMVKAAVSDYHDSMRQLGISPASQDDKGWFSKTLMAVRPNDHFNMPRMEATMRYSARIKTDAVISLGLYSMLKIFKKLMKKESNDPDIGKIKALKDGFKRMKQETGRSIRLSFKDYRENLKFQYLFRLTDAMVGRLYAGLLERFKVYLIDVSEAIELVKEKHVDKERMLKRLRSIEKKSKDYLMRLDMLRKEIESSFD